MKKASLILSLLLVLTLLPAGLTACSGGGEKSASQKTMVSSDSKTSQASETSNEIDTADLEEALIGKWVDLVSNSTLSIEFFDDHTAVLNLLNDNYDLEWEVTKSNPQIQSLDLTLKINGKDAGTADFLRGEVSLLTLNINGNTFQLRHK